MTSCRAPGPSGSSTTAQWPSGSPRTGSHANLLSGPCAGTSGSSAPTRAKQGHSGTSATPRSSRCEEEAQKEQLQQVLLDVAELEVLLGLHHEATSDANGRSLEVLQGHAVPKHEDHQDKVLEALGVASAEELDVLQEVLVDVLQRNLTWLCKASRNCKALPRLFLTQRPLMT